MAKIKLSVTRGENLVARNKIDDFRREKQLRLQILFDLVRPPECVLCTFLISNFEGEADIRFKRENI